LRPLLALHAHLKYSRTAVWLPLSCSSLSLFLQLVLPYQGCLQKLILADPANNNCIS
jgi:hypothetical protein